MVIWRRAAMVVVALETLGKGLAAQSPPTRTAPRMEGVSLAFLRYTSSGSLSVYLARRIGAGMLLTGAAGNMQSDYRAVLLGGGTHLRFSRKAGVTALVAAAVATDGASARLYLLPHVTTGQLVVTATAVAFQPMGGETRREVAVNPLSVALQLSSRLQLGAVVTVAGEQGKPVQTGFGPGVQLRLPGGTLGIEVVAERARTQVRGSFSGTL